MAPVFTYGGLPVGTDLDIPELLACSSASPELTVYGHQSQISPPGSWAHHWRNGSEVVLSVAKVNARYVLGFCDGRLFEFDRVAREVNCDMPLDASGRHQLLDHVLPRVLDDLGHLMIHGSGIDTPNGAVIFIGDTGLGKSTLAASFETLGADFLSDDCMRFTVETSDCVSCIPTYRSLRLWPDSAISLVPNAQSAPMCASSDKLRVDLPEAPPSGHSKVAAICVLTAPDRFPSAVTFCPIAPARAVALLLSQCFRLDPTDAKATKRAFERCADVVERVPVVELSYPRQFDRLPEVREAVLQRAASSDWTTVTPT